jgi:hypothetical protein
MCIAWRTGGVSQRNRMLTKSKRIFALFSPKVIGIMYSSSPSFLSHHSLCSQIHLQMIYFGREYCPAKDHQASECPICSWVNNPQRSPPTSFESFRRHSKNKGIIFYQDRISELADNPSLATLSLPSTSSMPETDSSAYLRSETIDSQTQPTTLRRGRSVSRKRIREENDSLS